MKLFVSLLCALSLGLSACQSEKTDSPATDRSTTNVIADTVMVQAAAAELVNRFQKDLKSELMSAIATRQPSGAIEVCRTVAPALADSHSTDGWNIRRVSDKNRNPDNRATAEEQAILAQFAAHADSAGGGMKFVMIDTLSQDSVHVFRYYTPIYTQQLCLNCHGGIQTLSPGVYQAVKKAYPDDKAVGYTLGQLRGMFVVEARWPEGEPLAKELAGRHELSE